MGVEMLPRPLSTANHLDVHHRQSCRSRPPPPAAPGCAALAQKSRSGSGDADPDNLPGGRASVSAAKSSPPPTAGAGLAAGVGAENDAGCEGATLPPTAAAALRLLDRHRKKDEGDPDCGCGNIGEERGCRRRRRSSAAFATPRLIAGASVRVLDDHAETPSGAPAWPSAASSFLRRCCCCWRSLAAGAVCDLLRLLLPQTGEVGLPSSSRRCQEAWRVCLLSFFLLSRCSVF